MPARLFRLLGLNWEARLNMLLADEEAASEVPLGRAREP